MFAIRNKNSMCWMAKSDPDAMASSERVQSVKDSIPTRQVASEGALANDSASRQRIQIPALDKP